MRLDWDAAVAFALTLPDTELSTYYGDPAVKVRANGRPFLVPGREAGSFGLAVDLDHKLMLTETDPATFWQTAHYDGWPMVLVRHDSPDPDRVRATIERSRDWTAARKAPKSRRKG